MSLLRSAATGARISSLGATATKLQPPVLTGAVKKTLSSPVTGSLPSARSVAGAAAFFVPAQAGFGGNASRLPDGATTYA